MKLYATANTANATGWRKMKISPNPLLWYLLQYAWSEMMNDARLDDQQWGFYDTSPPVRMEETAAKMSLSEGGKVKESSSR